jgi:hypothetical protein
MRHNKKAMGLALRPALVGRMGVAGMGKLEGSKIHQKPDFTHGTATPSSSLGFSLEDLVFDMKNNTATGMELDLPLLPPGAIGRKMTFEPLPAPDEQKVLCLECGDIKMASDFAPAQLKRKRPKCRACTGGSGAKMHSRPTGGHASKAEDDRSIELHTWERAGLIKDLREQVTFELVPKQDGERPVVYIADFVYLKCFCDDDELRGGGRIPKKLVVEDTKGHRTKEYVIKRKLMLWIHGIKITEICQSKRKRGSR